MITHKNNITVRVKYLKSLSRYLPFIIVNDFSITFCSFYVSFFPKKMIHIRSKTPICLVQQNQNINIAVLRIFTRTEPGLPGWPGN